MTNTLNTPPAPYRRECLEQKGAQCLLCPEDDPTTGWENIVVHHVDGDRSNNDLDNLIPVCYSCHSKIHHGTPGYEDWHEMLPESARRSVEPSSLEGTQPLTMYLTPETIKDEDIRFQELNLEYQREYDQKLQKNADYWPAVFEAAHSNQTVREILELDD